MRLGLWASILTLFVLCAGARAAERVYVVNNGSADISQYAIGAAGLLSPLTPPTADTGLIPDAMAVTPNGRSAYVVSAGGHAVWQYNIDPSSGELSPKNPATLATGPTVPTGMAVSPDGGSAYIASVGPNGNAGGTVSQYDIDRRTGALSPKAAAPVSAGLVPIQIAVTPNGRSAYVTNEDAGTVSQYSIDSATGALSPKSPASVDAVVFPYAIAVAPDGRSVYVTEEGTQGGDEVLQYDVNRVTGAISPKTPAGVPTAPFPEGIAISPNGRSAYVTSIIDDTVSQYSIASATGLLSPKTPATIAAGPIPAGVVVSPDGRSAYVANFGAPGSVSQYNIGPLSGALSPKTPPSVIAGSESFAIAIAPPPRHRRRVGK